MGLVGLKGLGPTPSFSTTCAPAPFVSSTGAPFTSGVFTLTYTAVALPSSVTFFVMDSSGAVLGTVNGVGPLTIEVGKEKMAGVQTPGVPMQLIAGVILANTFVDFQGIVTMVVA